MRMVAIILAASLFGVSAEAAAPQFPSTPTIWFAPLQPSRPDQPRAGVVDFDQLFLPGAPWSEAAKRIAAFKIYPAVAWEASDEQLRSIIAGLAARKIPLALEGDILIRASRCDPAPGTGDGIIPAVERLKRLGADLRYFDMNGPLVSGHTHVGRPACHASIADVAADAASTIKRLRAIYPNLQFGDIEPVGHASNYPDWSELPAWFAAFKSATGELPAFFHTDITWTLPWRDDLRRVAVMTAAAGVPLGVILDGTGTELSDEAYAASVRLHARQVEQALGHWPGQVLFQSWDPYPRHALPETDPTTMTGYVLDFLRVPTTLKPMTAASSAAPIHARLTDAAGAPIARASVVLEAVPPSPDSGLVAHSIVGTTPERARSALFALRVHTECTCPSAPTQLSLRDFSFAGIGQKPFLWNLETWSKAAPSMIVERSAVGLPYLSISVPAAEKLSLNGPRFPVAPGAPFDAKFLWHVSQGSAATGFAALIFFGEDGREVRRTVTFLDPSWKPVGRAQTDQDGNVVIARPASLPKATEFRLRFAGNGRYKPSDTAPPDQRR